MSRPDFVPDDPVQLAPGLSEMLADPNHYRRSEMAVVDYSEGWPDEPGLEPLGSLAGPKPEPDPPSRWARLRAALRGGKA